MLSGISTVLILLGMVSVPLGLVAVAAPGAIRVRSRWYGVAIMFGFLAAFGMAMLISPETSDGKASDVRTAGVACLIFSAFLTWVCHVLAKRSAASKDDTTTPKRAGLLERMAAAYGEAVAREQSKSEDRRAAKEATRKLRYVQTRPPKSRRAHIEIDYDTNAPYADEGEEVEFEYVDANGEVTDRVIRNWTIDGNHLVGYCTLRRASRRFRLDRVTKWRGWT